MGGLTDLMFLTFMAHNRFYTALVPGGCLDHTHINHSVEPFWRTVLDGVE